MSSAKRAGRFPVRSRREARTHTPRAEGSRPRRRRKSQNGKDPRQRPRRVELQVDAGTLSVGKSLDRHPAMSSALKYFINLALRTREQEGWRAASGAAAGLLTKEAVKIPRLAYLKLTSDGPIAHGQVDLMPPKIVPSLFDGLEHL